MKTKKFLAGGFILVFAIGSAVASAFQPQIPHVRGKVSITPEVWNCVPISNTPNCDDLQGAFECVVRIPVFGVNTNVLAYKGPGACSPETYCIVPLKRSSSGAVAGTPIKTIYEVRPWDLR